ncbi:MAG: calycin-like domain-containing protein [Prevotellamassilia sp.]|nr:calycin-like domain-containing protein [Prevotellamassilia sp.]
MRKILLTALLAAGGLTASAQYLPNGDFEQWKTTCGKSDQTSINKYLDTAPFGLATRPGVEPQDWNGSNVNQTVFGYNASSDALVTRQKEGDNSYVRLVCTKVGAKIGQGLGAIEIKAEAPAFINFGTPWVYAVSSKNKCDGGVYGGMPFSYKPDAIKGRYKRTPAATKEKARIIAYLWSGTFKSSIPSGKSTRMQDDVDRAIMGRVSGVAGDGKLVASCDYGFETTKNNDWEEIIVPIDYKRTDVVPTKMNIIISSDDYWNRANMVENSTLEVDDVQFVYYHALESITYKGKTIKMEEGKNFYNLLIDEDFDISKFSYEKIGAGATVDKSFDPELQMLTVTVKGNDFNVNPKSVTVYKFKVAKEVTDFTSDLSVELVKIGMFDPSESTIQLYKELDGSYTFQLRNFSLMGGMMPVGTIILKNLNVNGNKITTSQKTTIQPGDDPSVDKEQWMGPGLELVPIVLNATRNGADLTAQIDIDFTADMQIKVVFAPTIEINGTTDFTTIEPGLKNIHFTRPLKKGWNSICMPCNVNPFCFTIDEDTKLQELSSADDNGLNFVEVQELEANKPYLIYVPSERSSSYFGAEIVAAEPQAQCRGGFCFQGNYTPSFAMRNRYGVVDHGAEGQFIQKGGEKSTLPATGAYFTASGKPASVKLNLGGEVTGIDSNGVIISDSASAPVFDLKGVRVSNGSLEGLPKGLYIQGGKKVYVK